MKRTLAAAFLALAFALPAQAADTFTLDPNHTNIYWHANHFGFSTPSGKFATTSGTVTLDEAAPANSKVNVTITTGSIVTGIEKFDAHLKSKDFFDAGKFPTATFVSTKVEPTGKDTAKVTGTLTLHGVSKPVILDVKLNKVGEHPMTKKKAVGFTASTTIKRSDFGMSFGIPGVSDDVLITIEAEGAVA
jgi:polyisoprenoid-binding protein YceI